MQTWIEDLVQKRYGTTRALAQSVGMTESGFSRAVKAGTFEVENCLRLAHETGESADTVLTLAGKASVHELIEKLYGKAQKPKNPDAVKAYEYVNAMLDADAREGLLMMMRGYLKAQMAATSASPSKTKPTHR